MSPFWRILQPLIGGRSTFWRAVALAVVVSAPVSATAESWKLHTSKDAMTDETTMSANVVTSSGVLLSVSRTKSGEVHISLLLPKGNLDLFDPVKGFMVRIDSEKAHTLKKIPDEIVKLGIPQTFFWQPAFVSSLIWHGKEEQGRSAILRQLLSGKSLTLRYFVANGGAKDSTAPLDGAAEAISKALGITIEVSDQNKLAAAKFERYAELTAGCPKIVPSATTYSQCIDFLRACRDRASTPEEVSGCASTPVK